MITLHRPKALNALCDALINELNDLLAKLDADNSIGAIVITGSEKAFAAGADIKEMKDRTYPDTYNTQMLGHWDYITNIRYFILYYKYKRIIENLLLQLSMDMLWEEVVN